MNRSELDQFFDEKGAIMEPSTPAEDSRKTNKVLSIKLTEEEHKSIRDKATAMGLQLAPWARIILLNASLDIKIGHSGE